MKTPSKKRRMTFIREEKKVEVLDNDDNDPLKPDPRAFETNDPQGDGGDWSDCDVASNVSLDFMTTKQPYSQSSSRGVMRQLRL